MGDPTYQGAATLKWDASAQVKIYGTKIYSNNTLVKNFVPCVRISDNVAGLYETLSDTFLESYTTSSYSYQDITSGSIVKVYQDGLKDFSKIYMNGQTPDKMYYNGVTYDIFNEYIQISDEPGKWQKVMDFSGSWTVSLTKNNLRVENAPMYNNDEVRIGTTQGYDLTNYSKLKLTIKCNNLEGFDSQYALSFPNFYIGTSDSSYNYDWLVFDEITGGFLFEEGTFDTDYFEYTLTYDLSNITGSHYILLACQTGGQYLKTDFTFCDIRLYK